MKSKVSEENIEEFLESFNPLFDDQIINDIDKSNKRIWNSIESKVNLVQSESLGSSNKVTKVMWYRPYYLFFTLLISIGLCGLFFFNKSNVINAPENLPQTTFIPTTTNEPKRTIQNIDDLKPFASARIQELTDLSQNQIQDAVEKMKTDPNFALNDLYKNNKTYHLITLESGKEIKDIPQIYSEKLPNYNVNKPFISERWQDGTRGKFLNYQNNVLIAARIDTPEYKVVYAPLINSNIVKTKNIPPSPSTISNLNLRNKTIYNYELSLLLDFLASSSENKKVILKQFTDQETFVLETEKSSFGEKVSTVWKIDSDNNIKLLKLEILNANNEIVSSSIILKSEIIDTNDKTYELTEKHLIKDINIIQEETYLCYVSCEDGSSGNICLNSGKVLKYSYDKSCKGNF